MPISEEVFLRKRKAQAHSELVWFVLYTKPRAERIVQLELASRKFEVFLPMTKTLKVWKNRQKKWICHVLFPNYIFVKTSSCELYRITQIHNVVTYISCSGKPAIISSKEIEGIKEMINLESDISIETNYNKGERVRIVSGPLIGCEGILVEQKGKTRFGIQLKEICHTILIDIEASVLEKY